MMQSIPLASASSGYTVLCPSIPGSTKFGPDEPGRIYPATGGAFVEDMWSGNLDFCGGGHSKTIANFHQALVANTTTLQ
jgi:hypothetical protein